MQALFAALFLAIFAAIPAHASVADAAEAYRRGATLERSGDYEAALVEYQAALAHEPNYFYAYRQIGNCQVRLRQPQRALEAYDRYLAARPGDVQMRDYADRLRASVMASGQGGTGGGGSGTPAGSAQSGGFYAGADLQAVMLSADDINALVPEGSSKGSGGMGLAYGVEGGWRHPSGFFLQGAWFTGLSKNQSWKENSDMTTTSVKESMSGFYLAPGYRQRLPIKLPISVSGLLGVGMANFSYEYNSKMESGGVTLSETKVSASGAPMLIVAQAQADYEVIPHLNLGLDLGYQSAELTKIDGSNGNLKDAKGGDAKADFKGARVGLSATWAF